MRNEEWPFVRNSTLTRFIRPVGPEIFFTNFFLWGGRKDGRQLRPFKRFVLLRESVPSPSNVTWQSWCVTNSTPSWIESNLVNCSRTNRGDLHTPKKKEKFTRFIREIYIYIFFPLFFRVGWFFCFAFLPFYFFFFFVRYCCVSDPARSKWRNEPRGLNPERLPDCVSHRRDRRKR
jgi:hypothetical protein